MSQLSCHGRVLPLPRAPRERAIFTVVNGVAVCDAIPLFLVHESQGSAGIVKFSSKTNGHAKVFRMPQHLYEKLFGQLEVDRDLRLNLNRLAIE